MANNPTTYVAAKADIVRGIQTYKITRYYNGVIDNIDIRTEEDVIIMAENAKLKAEAVAKAKVA